MPVATSATNGAVEYRYFVCDLMTNELLAEIPFRGVSYTRSLTEAGTFTGDIAVTDDTYNLSLYENTLPAKTALYVLRDGVCVWGGIIWSRTYSLIDKVLSVTAAEFTSYLAHRVLWKTWNTSYEATAEISGNTMTATLTGGLYDFYVGEPVYIYWNEGYSIYNGYFEILTVDTTEDNRSIITVPAEYIDAKTGNKKDIPTLSVGEDNPITIETRQDTYNYVKSLLTELEADLFNFDFANDEIRPGIDLFNEVATISRSSNVATITTSKKHELVPGQKVKVSDVQADGDFDNEEAVVLDVLSDYIFTYSNEGSNVSTTSEGPLEVTISSFARSANVATFETVGPHGLSEGNIVYMENVSQTFDGYGIVYGTPSSTTSFQVVQIGSNIAKSYTETDNVDFRPQFKRIASVRYGTFGEFSTLGDIGFDLSQSPDYSYYLQANPIVRGFELKTVAEILDEYSTKPDGFEYRVDCVYDETTNTFKKYFKVLPLIPTSLVEYIESQPDGWTGEIPADAYGAEQLVFEFPGNVLEAQFEENADEAATRFFVQGKDSRLSSEASQPYSAAANHKLLRQGWPILDAVDDLDSDNETILYKQAARLLEEAVPPISTFTISVNGSARPFVGTYSPGDWCSVKLNDQFVALRAQSYLEQDYGTDNGVLVRKIISFSVTVPDTPSYPEGVELELVTEPSIPISGVTIIDGKAFLGN
jgi:hypothetical protein